jgi:thioredoxin
MTVTLNSYSSISIISIAILFSNCTNGQTNSITRTELSATEFAARIKDLPTAVIIDVRTPEEFSKGHLINALNYDWNGTEFDKQIAQLDKAIPVFVYCLSGGRSSVAAYKMRADGFTQVYEMDGGIMKWRSANLPETGGNTVTSAGMSKQQFNELLNSDKLVLIDFYADWCAPCKKMKPYLDEISKDMADKVVVVRINADDNQAICKELKVDALPVLHLYNNKTLTWSNTGFIEKAEVLRQLQ